MISFDLIQRVTHGVAEVLISGKDRSRHIELDDRLCPFDRIDLALVLGRPEFGRRDIRRKLHDSDGVAVRVEDRVVGRTEPDFPTTLGQPFELGLNEFASTEILPELGIFRRRRILLIAEYPVVLSDDLVGFVLERVKKILIGADDLAVEIEFDDRLHAV